MQARTPVSPPRRRGCPWPRTSDKPTWLLSELTQPAKPPEPVKADKTIDTNHVLTDVPQAKDDVKGDILDQLTGRSDPQNGLPKRKNDSEAGESSDA